MGFTGNPDLPAEIRARRGGNRSPENRDKFVENNL
jgi:hypothetical protein